MESQQQIGQQHHASHHGKIISYSGKNKLESHHRKFITSNKSKKIEYQSYVKFRGKN